jgi:hypothetical protein
MRQIRDWQQNRSMWIRVLKENTGDDVDVWNKRIEQKGFKDEQSLRDWLTQQSVTGYAQTLLVMERFGYPDFITASADQLIDAQYADRPHLRPIFDAILSAVFEFGEVNIQARKTYVSILSPRRTFARVQPTTKYRVDLGLRLDNQQPEGRLQRSTIHPTMSVQFGLSSVEEVDAEVLGWLQSAYEQNT